MWKGRTKWLFFSFSSFGVCMVRLWDGLCAVLFSSPSPLRTWFFPPATFFPLPTDTYLCFCRFCSHLFLSSMPTNHPSDGHILSLAILMPTGWLLGTSECPGTHFVFLGLFCRFLLLFTMDSCHIWILNSSLNFPILGLHLIVTPGSLPITACLLNSLTLPDHLLRKPKAAALCSLELCVSWTLHLFLVSCLFFFIKTR